jgi:hypothetical protein
MASKPLDLHLMTAAERLTETGFLLAGGLFPGPPQGGGGEKARPPASGQGEGRMYRTLWEGKGTLPAGQRWGSAGRGWRHPRSQAAAELGLDQELLERLWAARRGEKAIPKPEAHALFERYLGAVQSTVQGVAAGLKCLSDKLPLLSSDGTVLSGF